MIGVRTFDEISATMAEITGVSQNDPGVRAAMDEVRQSLPAIPSIEAYVSSHQAAIGQLAIEYCHALMENPTLRASTFPGFDFNAAPAAAFANENALFDPLLESRARRNPARAPAGQDRGSHGAQPAGQRSSDAIRHARAC